MGIIRRVGWGVRKSIRKDIRAARLRRAKWAAESKRQSAKTAAWTRARRSRKFQGPSCDIAHRSSGASLRCPQCNLGRARQAENTALLAEKRETNRKHRDATAAARVAMHARNRLAVPDARWRELLTPDGTAKALTDQRRYVRSKVVYATGIRPGLKHLTIGQAESILCAYNLDPAPLRLHGRDSVGKNRVNAAYRWLFGTLGFLVLCLIPVLGWIAAAGWTVALVVTLVQLSNRQAFEDSLVAGTATDPEYRQTSDQEPAEPRESSTP